MNDTQIKMAKSGLTADLLNLKLGASYASDLIRRRIKPSIDRAALIEREIGIPAASWADGSFLEHYWKKVTAK